MSVYTSEYESTYGGPPFPESPLDVGVELDLAGDWTDVTTYALQREGTSPPITIQRGRPSETSQATPSSATFQLNNRNGNFSPRNPAGEYYGQLAVRNNPLRISVPDATTYLRFADDSQSWCSCPDSSALQLTADFDLRLDMWLDDWQPCTLAGKWGGSDTLWAWCLTLNGDGTVTLTWYDGTDVWAAQSTVPLPYLGRIMVRATLATLGAGLVTFYTAPDMAGAQTELGDVITVEGASGAQNAATQAVQVGYVDGFLGQSSPSGSSGCLGKVYELQLYNSSGTLVAGPQFYNATAGASSFTDAEGNTWTVEGSATLSARSFRAHLECSSLPQQWDETGTDVWTPVGASGILRRLQQGNSPIWSVMRRGVTSTIASVWGVLAYWPCEDFQGSTSIASGLANGSPMLFSGAPAFQGTAGSLSADSVFACSAQLAQPSSSTWSFSIPRHTLQTVGDTVYFLLDVDSGGISADCTLLALNYASGQQITITYATATDGSLGVSGPGIGIDGPTNVNGAALWCSFQSNADGITLNVLPVGETVPTAYTGDTGINRTVLSGTVNPGGANLAGTEAGHLWASAAGPSIEGYADLLNAYNGETAAARFSRLCGENSITARIYGFPDVSAIMGPQEIDTLGNVLQSVEDADRGQIYEPAETLGLGYRTVHSLCAQSPAITLDYTQGVFGGDGSQGLVPTDDDQFTQNDVTLSRNNGSSYQYQVTSGPMSIQEPPNGAGDYATSLTVYVQSDAQLPYIASWMASVGTCDEERYPSVPLNLTRPQLASLFYAIQDVRIGDYVQILSPPSWLPPGDISQLAYGVTEQLGGYFWSLAWNAVPETPYEVAIAGTDASDSAHADTEGSELAGSYDATATSLSVETTEGPIWTTDGGSGAGQQSIVPLYSYPPSDFWADVTANAPTMAMIVCNVDNGPGTETESNFAAVFEAAAAAGITCLGYVPTGYGADTIASIEAQIDLWETYYGIVSINFDTVSPDEAYLSYYEELAGYVHGRGGIVVLNPGAIPAEGMMSIGADVVCVCEDSQANFATDAAAAPSWLFDYPATSIAVTCNQCSTDAEMVTVVGLSQSAFNAHYCWVTADAIYGAEPSYFADEVTELGYAPGGGGDFPFDILIGGEQITVNDITGDASPQTFSVIRSVNGVSKSQAEGAAVALFHAPIAALS
jgi:hypothetical protein